MCESPMRLTLAFVLALLPGWLYAECAGTDIRPMLSDAMRAEVRRAAEAEAYGEGNFWRATRGARTITLIGTVHLDDPRLDPLSQALAPEILGADRVFLEMTAREQAQLEDAIATRPEMILLREGSLIDLLPEASWEKLRNAAEARGIPGFMAARMQPWYLSLVLSMPPCLLTSGAPPEGLDARIEDIAVDAGIPTAAIEPYDTLFTLFASEPLEVQLDFLGSSVMDDNAVENMLTTTMNAYFEQAPAELWHLSRIAARDQIDISKGEVDALFEALEEALLVRRNLDWMEVLRAAQDKDIVVAVGAAHLFGKTGLVRLLEQDGYAIERLTPQP